MNDGDGPEAMTDEEVKEKLKCGWEGVKPMGGKALSRWAGRR